MFVAKQTILNNKNSSLNLAGKFIQATTILLMVFLVCTHSAPPSFRVIAPQNFCEMKSVGINFQPKDGIKFSYKIRIFFENTRPSTERNYQRLNLLIWQSVRMLENRLNKRENELISKRNTFTINATEVTPGVIYTFHAIGITDAGDESTEQVFTIKYLKNVENSANLMLIGSENTVANIPYVVKAKVTFCGSRSDFDIRWRMQNLDEEFQDILHTGGTTLKIPSNTLTAGKSYILEASVVQRIDSRDVLAQNSIAVEVMKRGFEVFIIPTLLKTGLNKPVMLELFITFFDNNYDTLKVQWECNSLDHGEKCEKGESTNQTKFEIFFKDLGKYRITALVNLGNIQKSVISEVHIDPNIFISYEFSHIPALIMPAGQRLQFSLLLLNLIENCTAGWSSAQEDGYTYVSPKEMNLNDFGKIEIDISEDNKNYSVNREITLEIPEAKSEFNWKGLNGDANYKFRLDAICPAMSSTQNGDHGEIVSSFEFIVHTNAAPSGGNMQVSPDTGSALRTIFTISFANAHDILLDSPLNYEFFILIEKFTLSLGMFYEFKAIETTLPYTTSIPIKIFGRICDIRQSCTTLPGPNVQTTFIDFTKLEFEDEKMKIVENFRRGDLDDGQNAILMAAITFKNGNIELFNEFKKFASELIMRQLNEFYNKPSDWYHFSTEHIVRFISQTKINFDYLEINDPAILEILLNLLEKASNDIPHEDDDDANSSDNHLEKFNRKRRDVKMEIGDIFSDLPEARSVVDGDFVRMSLDLMDQILQSHTDAELVQQKPKVPLRVTMLTAKMCRSDQVVKESIYSRIASIDVEKMSGNQVLEKKFIIPNYYSPSVGSFMINIPELKSRQKYFCVSQIQFPEDYFSGSPKISFYVQIFDMKTFQSLSGTNGKHRDIITLHLPKEEITQNMCLMRFADNNWSEEICQTNDFSMTHVVCRCSNFGYLKLSTKMKDLEIYSTSTETIPPTEENRLLTMTTERKSNLVEKEPKMVSSWSSIYLIPLALLTFVLIVSGGVVYYQRKQKYYKTSMDEMHLISKSKIRKTGNGIRYAQFFDEDLMNGSTNFSIH